MQERFFHFHIMCKAISKGLFSSKGVRLEELSEGPIGHGGHGYRWASPPLDEITSYFYLVPGNFFVLS